MKIKLFLDGANLEEILSFKNASHISGFTTNPSLMKKAGVSDYMQFAETLAKEIPKDKDVSLEVVADELPEMERQAAKITEVSENFYAKIPITNTKGEFTGPIIKSLGDKGVKVNVTAIMTASQVTKLSEFLSDSTPSVVSVFAGRIADTGIDPRDCMYECVKVLNDKPVSELLWASCREVFNIYQACQVHPLGYPTTSVDIITVSSSIIHKFFDSKDKNLDEFSLETVKDFYKDAQDAGYSL